MHQNISGDPKNKLDLENIDKFVIKTDQKKDQIQKEVKKFMKKNKGKIPEEEKNQIIPSSI